MKYYFTTEKIVNFNAGTKAINDTNQILEKNGYTPLNLGTLRGNPHSIIGKIYKTIIEIYHLFILFHKSSSQDIFFLQWPLYHIISNKIVYRIIKYRCKHLQILIHDINSLRGYSEQEQMEYLYFSLAELIIVHTNRMKLFLIKEGIPEYKIKILSSFDYLTSDPINLNREKNNIIVYAGNLIKSPFLQYINESQELTINCYGKEMPYTSPCLNYKGAFKSENVSVLEGSWGLVWDGISINSCTGEYGDYLQYNAPHKLSLYIAAGLPIVIWEKSGLAEYIVNKNLGITINSISELASAISNISTEEYINILTNIENESKDIRQGKHLLKCIF